MKKIKFCVLLLLSVVPFTYLSAQVLPESETISQNVLSSLTRIKEKTFLSENQQSELSELLTSYHNLREKLFLDSEQQAQEVYFPSLKELYENYRMSEESILTTEQLSKLYGKENKTRVNNNISTLSGGINPMASGGWHPGENIIYAPTIQSPQSVTLPYYQYVDQPLAYYVDFGDETSVDVEWELDFTLGPGTVEIYAVMDRDSWMQQLEVITGVNSGSLISPLPNGRLVVYISPRAIDGGNTKHAPLKFTFRKTNRMNDEATTVMGKTYFEGNVGIHTSVVNESLEVKGAIKIKNFNANSTENNLTISTPNTSYTLFNTNSGCFLFNQSVLSLNGIYGTYGGIDLNLRTDGYNRITVKNKTGDVGIDIANPAAKLHINGDVLFSKKIGTSGANNLELQANKKTYMTILHSNGNVGIGTTASPTEKLEVNGHIKSQKLFTSDDIQIGTTAAPMGGYGKKLYFGLPSENSDKMFIARYNAGSDKSELRVNIGDDGNDKFVVGSEIYNTSGFIPMLTVTMNGKVGIGVSDPKHELEIKGKIKAEEVIITTAGADFVFEKNYKLLSLQEVEEHIESKKHLPDVPSAADMSEKGVGMAELQIKLLQKIEELTLYVIQQQKEIDGLKKQIKNQN